MSRIALIGENSIEYVNVLLDIWNDGNCAVIIDQRIPFKTAYEMMLEADVQECYIENIFFAHINEVNHFKIKFIPFENMTKSATLLPKDLYNKFRVNYSRKEALVIYSSGTTGKSKGIILSHFAISTNADAIVDYMGVRENDCLYIAKSLSHSSTMVGELLVALKSGAGLVLAPTAVPPRFVLNNLSRYNVTTVCLNPTLLRMYTEECLRKSYAFTSLKKIYVSGSILNDQVYRMAHDTFGDIDILNVYGLSEAGPRVTAQKSDCCKSNSVGKPIKNVEIVVVDDSGKPVSEGVRGIIHVRTPSLFSGYVIGEEKHPSLYREWLNTGDIGYMDENGELHITERVDDLIIIDAHKIYPSEIEKVILECTTVKECVVVKVDINGNDCIGCLYVGDEEIMSDIKGQLKNKLLPYEKPQFFTKCDKLPKTTNGKIVTKEVRNCLKKSMGE